MEENDDGGTPQRERDFSAASAARATLPLNPPLAEQLRPQTLDEYIGQSHIMGKGAVLQQAIITGNLPSMILWGPPGVGKTTLAYLISKTLNRPFYTLSATQAGVKDVRDILEKTRSGTMTFAVPILFIDEIHRFSKSQQDSLLQAVEKGWVTFIGATTENPSFEVITPLLSRSQVYVLKPFSSDDLDKIIDRAVKFLEHYLKTEINIVSTYALKRISGGDGRKLLNAIEMVVTNGGEHPIISDETVASILGKNLAAYDKKGENHYDIISAFIKSIRGSDPNATAYYLARMLEGGEDPKFIARRMLILASEDIGNANPNALLLANACFDAVHKVGYPECRITLSHVAVYLACSAKSNAAYMAIENALEFVRKTGDMPVPLAIRNAPTKLMKELGYHQGYKYAHDFEGNFADLEFLPQGAAGTTFYFPSDNPKENEIRAKLRTLWKEKYGY
ncbi:MAG: replication-associated recombination protein A [Bacteroidales bacterium]|jgi:putative ATPase|nr:replication-associated recombination protein A [Bacteroidales bacterium]